MSQIRTNSLLTLQLTPVYPLDLQFHIEEEPTGLFDRESQAVLSTRTLVRPGERSEMVLQVKNRTSNPLYLEVDVRGNFPRSWLSIHREGQTVIPYGEMLIGIYFEIPSDWFEADQSNNNSPSVILNYSSLISLYYWTADSNTREVETLDFQLYVRPHVLYGQFLPALYREVDFIGRFLKIFEETFEPSVHMLEAMWAYLDPLTSPAALIAFLAQWVGWEMIPGIDLNRTRQLVRNAISIYRLRGTREGLRFYLHLYTGLPLDEDLLDESDKHICIIEPFGAGFILAQSSLGVDTVLGGGRPFYFTVRLRPEPNSAPLNQDIIHTIIEQQKPVHCTYNLYIETAR